MSSQEKTPSKKTPFYYHLGSEKCASTLVETVFHYPEVVDHMAKRGVVIDFSFHRTLRDLGEFEDWDEQTHGKIRRLKLESILRTTESQSIRYFSTEESLLGLSHEVGRKNRCAERIEFIKRLTDGFDLHPIIIFRRQDGFIESLYNQNLKTGETREFADFTADLPLENYEWDTVADEFADAFGADKLTVLPYDATILTIGPGHPSNVVSAIARIMGFDIELDVPIINPSFPKRFIPVQLAANRNLEAEEAAAVAESLRSKFKKVPGERLDLFSAEERVDIVARFEDSNRRLAETYLPGFDASYLWTV